MEACGIWWNFEFSGAKVIWEACGIWWNFEFNGQALRAEGG